MAFSKRAQTGKIVNREQNGGHKKSGIPSSIGRNRQLIFKIKSRSYTPQRLNSNQIGGIVLDGPISGATITIKTIANGTIIGTTVSNSVGEFSFGSNVVLQPNTYYLLESSTGTDTITNLTIEVGLKLFIKTDATGYASVVISPVSTILNEMISLDLNDSDINQLTTEQIDGIVSTNKELLVNYLDTSNNNNNIETTNFFKTSDVNLYKENAAIYSYLRSTYELTAVGSLDERQPIIELIDIIINAGETNQRTIRGIIASDLSTYSETLTINNSNETISDLITDINNTLTIDDVSTVLSQTYVNVTYPKQYNWTLEKTISTDTDSPYGVGIDPSGRYLTYTKGAGKAIILDLSNNNEVLIVRISQDSSGEFFDSTMNHKYVVIGTSSAPSSLNSYANGKGYVRVYKKSNETWVSMIDISGTAYGDAFGYGLGINGDTLIVSAYRSNKYADLSGVTTIYNLDSSNNTATVVKEITKPGTKLLGVNDGTAISSKYAVVGCADISTNVDGGATEYKTGLAIVYKKNNIGNWELMTEIKPETKYINGEKGHFNANGTIKDPSSATPNFGFSASITDTHLAIGAYNYSDVSGDIIKSKVGSVSLYKINDAETWDYVTTFVGDVSTGNYGYDIKLTDNFLFVSSVGYKVKNDDTKIFGVIYVYEKGPYNSWAFKNKLENPLESIDQNRNSKFGYKMDIKDDYLVVTDSYRYVYLYKKNEII